jgi:peptidoglycan/xylan/chitin deacetylase (PgdA/CDA1 family)
MAVIDPPDVVERTLSVEGFVLHKAVAAPGTPLARVWSGEAPRAPSAAGGLGELVAASTPGQAGLSPEAIALSLRRGGAEPEWGAPVQFRNLGEVASFARTWGRQSVEAVRRDPTLLTGLYLGSWFELPWRRRLARRPVMYLSRGWPAVFALVPRRLLVDIAVDAAFWAGVRSAATSLEWERFTRSSYSVLYYHRLAGEGREGEERIDIAPREFARQMRLLRRLRFTPLTVDDVLRFHADSASTLPRRGFVLTVDDGFRDAVLALRQHGRLHAQVFVCTDAVGGESDWTEPAALASWDELEGLTRTGAVVGSHGTRHRALVELSDEALAAALAASRKELAARALGPASVIAYPHGQADERVKRAAARLGYRLGYTTRPGKNGAGTDPLGLRRVGPKEWDSTLSLLWKAWTGELVPGRWERRLIRRDRRGRRPRPSSSDPIGGG